MIPVAALLIYTNLEERHHAITNAQEEALTRVQAFKVDLEQKVEGARQLLITLAQLHDVLRDDPKTCTTRLTELNELSPSYSKLGVALPNGDILCSTVFSPWPINAIREKYAWFQRAMETRSFSVGDYEVEPGTDNPVLTFSCPILDGQNQVQGVVFAVIRLNTLHQLAAETQYPAQIDLLTLDRNGTILDRHPQPEGWVGKTLPEAPLIQIILTQGQGITESIGIDGVNRLYAFVPADNLNETGLYVCAGIPTDAVFAEANATLLRNLLALGPIAALALTTASFFANARIVRHVKGLVSATKRLRRGDLSARSQVVSQTAELDELALAFNDMVATLEQREAQRRLAEDSLREQREILQVTLSSIGDAVIATNARGNVTFMNLIAESLTGWTQTEAIGQSVDEVFTLINENTRQSGENSVPPFIQEGAIAGLASHTLLVTRQGHEIPIDNSGAPIRNAAGDLAGVVFVFRDITRRRRAEHRLLIQYTVARILAEYDSLEEVATQVLQAICEDIGWEVGVLWRVDHSANVLRHEKTWQSSALPDTEFQAVNRDTTFQPDCDLPGRSWTSGQPLWSPDIRQDAQFTRIDAAIKTGLQAALALPIRSRSKVVGVLECLSDTRHQPDADLLTMLEALGSQIGNFIERKEAEEALYKTSMILQAVFEGTTDSIYVKDRKGHYLLANSAIVSTVGQPVQDIIDKDDTYLYSPETAQIIMEEDQHVMASGLVQTLENVITLPGSTRIYHSVKAPYRDVQGRVIGLIGISRDVTDLKHTEKVQRLLAETSRLLTASLNDETRLANVAKLLVPDWADWCAIDVIMDDQSVRRLAMTHVDPAKAVLADDLYRRYPPDWNAPVGVPRVLRTGQSEVIPEMPDDLLEASAGESEHLKVLSELGLKSTIIVPMIAHDRTLGAMTLAWSESDREYTPTDVALAQDLASRCALALDNARLYGAESAARAEAEAARQRLTFLAEASRALMASADVNTRLESLTHYVVPTLADWCTVNLVEPDGSVWLAAAAHRDPDKTPKIHELAERYPFDPAAASGALRVLRTGLPETSSRILGERLDQSGDYDDYERRLEELGFKSYMIVPLKARGRTIGAMTLVSANPGRPYTRADLTLAEELAAHAALAVDSALLYQEAQQLNAELDHRVKERTALLQTNNEKLQEQIAERLRAETELAEVQRQQAQGREGERLHLAQELHDGPIQALYGISYRLAGLKDARRDDASVDQLTAAQAELQRVIHTLRNISSELRPPTLTPFGLRTAIQSHAERFQAAHSELQVHLDLMPDRQQLPEAVRLALFRIYQQMLANVVRHTQAHHVHVRFAVNAEEAVLEIRDDGCGFDVPKRWIELARQGHLGLIGASERAEALGGTFKVTSAPGEGTLIWVSVPLVTNPPGNRSSSNEERA